jgi:hypothetical protein
MSFTKPNFSAPTKINFHVRIGIALLALVSFFPQPPRALASGTEQKLLAVRSVPALPEFIASIKNGRGDQVVGIHVRGILALPVTYQPANNPAYVANLPGVATLFRMAYDIGVTGILAHNTHAGAAFFDISIGQEAVVIYGDGSTRLYRITEMAKFQALSPKSPYSDFISLNGVNERLSAAQVFTQMYGPEGRLVMQTCIEAEGNPSWGRIFIIGEPIQQAKTAPPPLVADAKMFPQ